MLFRATVLATVLGLFAALPLHAGGVPGHSTSLPWQQLQDFALAHGRSVVVHADGRLPAELPPALRPVFAAELDRLLAGSGWGWYFDRSGGIVVVPLSQASVDLPTLEITARENPAVGDGLDLGWSNPFRAAAIGAERVEGTRLRWLGDDAFDRLLRRAPNISVSADSVAVRGIERGDGTDATAQVYLDGIPLAGSYLRRGLLPRWLAHVDFLRGPRSGFDALGGLAGAIEMVTPAPQPVPAAAIDLGLGSDGHRTVAARGDTLLHPAGLSGGVQVTGRDGGSTIVNANGLHNASGQAVLASGRLAFEPDALETLTVDLAWLLARDTPAERAVVPSAGSPLFDPFARISHERFPVERKLDADGLRMTAVWNASVRDELRGRWVSSETAARASNGTSVAGERSALHEHESSDVLHVGWTRQWQHNMSSLLAIEQVEREAGVENRLTSPLEPFFPGAADVVVTPDTRRIFSTSSDDRAREHSVIAGLDWQQDAWSWRIGSRLARTARSSARTVSSQLDRPDCRLSIDGVETDCENEFPAGRSRRVTPSRQQEHAPYLGLRWQPDRRWFVDLSARRGLLPGGARLNPADGTLVGYRAERSDTVELGSGWISPDGRLVARLTLFANRWRDRHVRVELPQQGAFLIRNAGEAQASGGELQLRFAADEALSTWVGVGWLHTRFDRFVLLQPGGSLDLSGNAFPGAPEWTIASGATFVDGDWQFGISGWASAAAFSDARNSPVGRRSAHGLLDLRLARAVGARAEVWLAVSNLLDEDYLEHVRVAGTPALAREYVPGAPRQWSIGAGWRW